MAQLNYEQMIDKALLSVVKAALRHIGKEGPTGAHHFYISFLTNHPGISLPPHIQKAYPDEITIVLQHEFWNLDITDQGFSVDVKFDTDVPNTISVPFAAITHVSDPDANFELEFNPKVGEVTSFSSLTREEDTSEPALEGEGTVISLDSFRKK